MERPLGSVIQPRWNAESRQGKVNIHSFHPRSKDKTRKARRGKVRYNYNSSLPPPIRALAAASGLPKVPPTSCRYDSPIPANARSKRAPRSQAAPICFQSVSTPRHRQKTYYPSLIAGPSSLKQRVHQKEKEGKGRGPTIIVAIKTKIPPTAPITRTISHLSSAALAILFVFSSSVSLDATAGPP